MPVREWWATKTRYPPYKKNGGQQKPVTHPTKHTKMLGLSLVLALHATNDSVLDDDLEKEPILF